MGPFSKLVLCEYLNKENYTCDAKCLPCKLFTCDYLESKGIKFKIKDILLLNVFFNPIQKLETRWKDLKWIRCNFDFNINNKIECYSIKSFNTKFKILKKKIFVLLAYLSILVL